MVKERPNRSSGRSRSADEKRRLVQVMVADVYAVSRSREHEALRRRCRKAFFIEGEGYEKDSAAPAREGSGGECRVAVSKIAVVAKPHAPERPRRSVADQAADQVLRLHLLQHLRGNARGPAESIRG